jgi:hypothetical protein
VKNKLREFGANANTPDAATGSHAKTPSWAALRVGHESDQEDLIEKMRAHG